MRVSFVVQEEGQWTLDICRKPSAQCRIGRGWSWAPGWVTVVSLCCFCNVALIFATMKTFILQQVKCCHLSPFLFKLILCRIFPQSILPLNFFFFFFPFSVSRVFLCFRHHLLFISEIITPRLHLPCCHRSLTVCLSISASGDLRGTVFFLLFCFVFLWGDGQRDLTFPSPSSVQISASSPLLWVHSY